MPSQSQRQTLLDLAAEAFARHGYAGASVRTITDAAEMNPAMVGYYFGSKEGLFRAVLEDRAARIQERVEWAERGSDSPKAARQRAYLHAVLEDFPELLHILIGHAMTGASGFPATDCRTVLADMLAPFGQTGVLEGLCAALLSSPTPLMERPVEDRRTFADSLKSVKKRQTSSTKAPPSANAVKDTDEVPRYPQPSPGDDFLGGFVD